MGQGKGGVMSGTGKRWGHEWDMLKVGSEWDREKVGS